jgi:hypothetical protein
MAYTTADGATTCTMCSAGTFNSNAGWLPERPPLCTACVAGTAGPPGFALGCMFCGHGKYSSAAGATVCSSCELGKYILEVWLATTCNSCPVNTYSTPAISTFQVNKKADDYCLKCPAGVFSPPASSVCLNCAPGFAHVGGTCGACGLSLRQYAPYYGMTSCFDCPTNTYASVPNATVAFHCRCLPGYVCQYTPQRFVVGLRHPSLSATGFRAEVAAAARVAAANVTLR